MEDKVKVLFIDPWGISNNSDYLNGLSYGLSDYVDLTVFTNANFRKTTDKNYKVIRHFFPKSDTMKPSKIRTLLRGLEYVWAYCEIIRLVKNKKQPFDIIHINWLLKYKIDKVNVKKLKKHCTKLIYTAHNVIPHMDGEKSVPDLYAIYSVMDTIILHGENVKKEFTDLFPEFSSKIFVQKHGCNLVPNTSYDMERIDRTIIEKVSRYDRIFIFFGIVFYNKGVDRIIKYWLDNDSARDTLLIVAGKKNGEYRELAELEDRIAGRDNILYLDFFVEDNLLNYLIDSSDLILMPYRHASMSGVVFTASDFRKPILCTKTGALEEYLEDGTDSFLVENDDGALYREIDFLIKNSSSELLSRMGENLHGHIHESCSWNEIARNLYDNCYSV